MGSKTRKGESSKKESAREKEPQDAQNHQGGAAGASAPSPEWLARLQGRGEWTAIHKAFGQVTQEDSGLKLNAARLKNPAVVAAWQLEDARGSRLWVMLTMSPEGGDPLFSVEADLGQFLELDAGWARQLLEINYSQATLSRLALSGEGHLKVVHRRYLEGLNEKDVIDAIAEVWNLSQHLRKAITAVSPGQA